MKVKQEMKCDIFEVAEFKYLYFFQNSEDFTKMFNFVILKNRGECRTTMQIGKIQTNIGVKHLFMTS